MNAKKALWAACLLAALPIAARAGDMSYSYVELGYVFINPENGDSNTGAGVHGSIAFGENLFGFAEFSTFSRGSASDLNVYAVGLGGHYGITDRMDLVARVGAARAETSTLHDTGFVASGGMRAEVAEGFELEAHVNYSDFGDTDNGEAEIALGGRYFFTDRFAVGAEFAAADDGKSVFAGVRFAF